MIIRVLLKRYSELNKMKKYALIILTCLPFSVFAEGQDAFGIIFGTIDFIKVFGIWAILIWGLIRSFEYLKSNKLEKRKKRIIWITTGLLSLFIWSMILHDPHPYDGPIDSIFNKKPTSDPESAIEPNAGLLLNATFSTLNKHHNHLVLY